MLGIQIRKQVLGEVPMVSGSADIGSQFFPALAYPLSLSSYCLHFCWFCVVITTGLPPAPIPGKFKMRNCRYRMNKDIVNRKKTFLFGKQENKHIFRVTLPSRFHKQVFRYKHINNCMVNNTFIFNKGLKINCDLIDTAYFSSQARIITLKICLHECSIIC